MQLVGRGRVEKGEKNCTGEKVKREKEPFLSLYLSWIETPQKTLGTRLRLNQKGP